MTRTWVLRDTLGWKRQLGLSAGLTVVLALSLTVPINGCVIGELGGVSDLLRIAWTLATGSATLVSFVLAVRKYRAETTNSDRDDEPSDSHTAIHVESVEGDVDLSVTLDTSQREHRHGSNVSRPPKDDSDAVDEKDLDPDSTDAEESTE